MTRTRRRKVIHAAAALAAAGMLTASVPAFAISVDGNLGDLIGAVGGAGANAGQGVESGADAEGNGFDITNVYGYYDLGLDTLYLGMSFFGSVGTSGGDEGDPFAFWLPEPGVAGVFDANENYGFNVRIGSNALPTVALDLTGDSTTGGEIVAALTQPAGISLVWAVSEANNGVEFSVSGLNTHLGGVPANLDIGFFAGSVSNPLPEDSAHLSVAVVPVPAAAWLFGSGLMALAPALRRRSAKRTTIG